VTGECVDMGIDSGPNIGALRRSAEADFGRNFSGGNFFWEGY
jgi:hypothetical protein